MSAEPGLKDPYINFQTGIKTGTKEGDFPILDDSVIRNKISLIRDTSSTEDQKTQAYEDIYKATIRLIPFVIRQSAPKDIPRAELVSLGFETIRSCIDHFDLDAISSKTNEPRKFSAYVAQNLRITYHHAYYQRDRLPLPFSGLNRMVGYILKIDRKYNELAQEYGRTPTVTELYDAIGGSFTFASFQKFYKLLTQTEFVDVDATSQSGHVLDVSDDEELQFTDIIPNTSETAHVESEAELKHVRDQLSELLAELKPRERRILVLRFGLDDDTPLTLEKIGEIMGITGPRVRQIEKSALVKLRTREKRKKLGDY